MLTPLACGAPAEVAALDPPEETRPALGAQKWVQAATGPVLEAPAPAHATPAAPPPATGPASPTGSTESTESTAPASHPAIAPSSPPKPTSRALPAAEEAALNVDLAAAIELLSEHMARLEEGIDDGIGEHLREAFAILESLARHLAHCEVAMEAAAGPEADRLDDARRLWAIADTYRLAQVAIEWVAGLRDGCGLMLWPCWDESDELSGMVFTAGNVPRFAPLAWEHTARRLAHFVADIDQHAACQRPEGRRAELLCGMLRDALAALLPAPPARPAAGVEAVAP